MKLSEVAYTSLRKGDKIVSPIGTKGIIMELTGYSGVYKDSDGKELTLIWETGKRSQVMHKTCTEIDFVEVTE